MTIKDAVWTSSCELQYTVLKDRVFSIIPYTFKFHTDTVYGKYEFLKQVILILN